MMHMWFWTGTDLGLFLFSEYKISTAIAFISTCFGLFALAIMYEAMRTLQLKLHRMTKMSLVKTRIYNTENSSLLYHLIPKLRNFSCTNRSEIYHWILEVAHYSVHTTVGYVLMLTVMTYNVYVVIVLLIGSAIGYWIFSPDLLYFNMSTLRKKYNQVPCNPICAEVITNSIERRNSTVSIVAEQLVSEMNSEIQAVIHA